MNTLVALGTGVAWLFSSIVLFAPSLLPGVDSHEIYFETASVVVALILLGNWLEARAKHRASDALRQLASLTPRLSHRIVAEGPETEDVETEFVRVGDRLLVKGGESVPVDGKILDGGATLDESMMTGESRPVEKQQGELVIGGTLNLGGAFTLKAENIGEETVLSGIIPHCRCSSKFKGSGSTPCRQSCWSFCSNRSWDCSPYLSSLVASRGRNYC